MQVEIEYIDSFIEDAFNQALEVINQNCGDDDKAVCLALALRKDISFKDEKCQNALSLLQSFYSIFIRYAHAEVLASLLKGNIIIDSSFGVIFDKRINELNFSDLSLGYLVELINSYIDAISNQNEKELPEEYLRAVQKVCPLYKLSSLTR